MLHTPPMIDQTEVFLVWKLEKACITFVSMIWWALIYMARPVFLDVT
jgi:hypothetical protein